MGSVEMRKSNRVGKTDQGWEGRLGGKSGGQDRRGGVREEGWEGRGCNLGWEEWSGESITKSIVDVALKKTISD
jgi:hypothetical protein